MRDRYLGLLRSAIARKINSLDEEYVSHIFWKSFFRAFLPGVKIGLREYTEGQSFFNREVLEVVNYPGSEVYLIKKGQKLDTDAQIEEVALRSAIVQRDRWIMQVSRGYGTEKIETKGTATGRLNAALAELCTRHLCDEAIILVPPDFRAQLRGERGEWMFSAQNRSESFAGNTMATFSELGHGTQRQRIVVLRKDSLVWGMNKAVQVYSRAKPCLSVRARYGICYLAIYGIAGVFFEV